MNRVTILKCCIEHLIEKSNGDYDDHDIANIFEYISLPSNIQSGLLSIVDDKYFHLYPNFWQFFTYVYGGFILEDFETKEYEHISENTGIPVEHIPAAFSCFDKLFPITGGWQDAVPKTNIRLHRYFPLAFSGIGANYRRLIYTQNGKFEELRDSLQGLMTYGDLIKWNNLTYKILSS